MPLGGFGLNGDLGPAGSVTSSGSFKLSEFNGGLHVNLTRESRVTPYIAGGIGVGHTSGSASYSVKTPNSTTTGSVSASGNNLGVNGGFGVKLYAGRMWGIQPEVKVFRFTGDGGGTAIRFGADLFFDFGK